jgi:hypothetical protein
MLIMGIEEHFGRLIVDINSADQAILATHYYHIRDGALQPDFIQFTLCHKTILKRQRQTRNHHAPISKHMIDKLNKHFPFSCILVCITAYFQRYYSDVTVVL